MCFLATLQCAVMAFFLESNYLQIWKLSSFWEFPCILYGVSSPESMVDQSSGHCSETLNCTAYWSIKLNTFLQGVFASGANFFLQSWCISVKGPLYSAIFTPLSAVITTILSTLFLHEELHIGRYAQCDTSTQIITALVLLHSEHCFVQHIRSYYYHSRLVCGAVGQSWWREERESGNQF